MVILCGEEMEKIRTLRVFFLASLKINLGKREIVLVGLVDDIGSLAMTSCWFITYDLGLPFGAHFKL